MSKSKLKKYIAGMSPEQIGEILLEVYDASREAKAWLDFYLDPDVDGFSEKYRKQIHLKCYGRNGNARRPKMRDCTRLISAFAKIVQDPTPIADLMLYFMEEVTRVGGIRGRWSESYCRSLAGHFRKTLEYLESTGLLSNFEPRVKRILSLADRSNPMLGRFYSDITSEMSV